MIEDLARNHNYDAAVNIALNDNFGNNEPNQEQQEELDFHKLNNEQRELVDSVLQAVHGDDPTQPKYFYVDAPARRLRKNICLLQHR